MKKILFTLLFLVCVYSSAHGAATYFLSQTGTAAVGTGCLTTNPCPLTLAFINTNGGPDITFKIKNGTHSCGTCLGGGNGITISGTAGHPMILQCETFNAGYPDQAGPGCTLNANGEAWVIYLNGTSYVTVQGIYMHNVDFNPGSCCSQEGGGIYITNHANNNRVYKNIISGVNTWGNVMPLIISNVSCSNVIQENDLMRSHRNIIENSRGSQGDVNGCQNLPNVYILNHASNGLAREPHGGYTVQQLGPAQGPTDYAMGDTIWENNVVDSVVSNCYSSFSAPRIRHYGDIALNCGDNGFSASSDSTYGTMASGIRFKDLLVHLAQQGIWFSPDAGAGNTDPWILQGATASSIGAGYSFLVDDTTIRNAGAPLVGLPGIQVSNAYDASGNWFQLQDPKAHFCTAATCKRLENSASTASVYTGFTLVNTPPTGAVPVTGQSSCIAYTPSTSSLYGKGTSGGNIGADVIHLYQNEVRTGIARFDFNPATYGAAANRGRDMYGPGIISSVNDASVGHVRATLHTELGFGTGGCPSPAGVTTVTVNITTNGGANFQTASSTANLAGTSNLP